MRDSVTTALYASLEESFQKILEIVLEETSDCVSIKDKNGRYLFINPRGASLLNLTQAEVIGKSDFELFTQEAAQKIRETDELVLHSGQPMTFEAPLKPQKGESVCFRSRKTPLKNQEGDVLGIVIVTQEITEVRIPSSFSVNTASSN